MVRVRGRALETGVAVFAADAAGCSSTFNKLQRSAPLAASPPPAAAHKP